MGLFGRSLLLESGWTRVSVSVPDGLEELLAEALLSPPLTGIEQQPGRLLLFVSAEHDTPAFRQSLERNAVGLGAQSLEFQRLPDVDWEASWRERWRPFRIGRICVGAPDARFPNRAGDCPLRLLPGAAFGTGRHATTRGALLGLQRLDLLDCRLLDAGSGSGVLGVAAVLLGARSVLGIDIDPNAPSAGRTLAHANQVADRCRFVSGDLTNLDPRERDFDGFVANLYYDLIQTGARQLAGRLREGGFFVFSGCRISERDRTVESIEAAGLDLEWEHRRGRWLAFSGRKRRLVPSEGLEPSTR